MGIIMAYGSNILTSIFGRRLGLQNMTTTQSGGSAPSEYLVGAEDVRLSVTTAETSGTNAKAFGISNFPGTSAGSSTVYTLDPPIPGVKKYLAFTTTGNGVYVKTANNETILSTVGSTFTTIKSTAGGAIELIGLTTAIWLGLDLSSGTSSQASGFSLTTST